MKTISVIVPFYNVREYIEPCLKSISKAVEKIDTEVIIIDDGSNDGSSEIASAYADRHQDFSYYRRDNNRGISSTRNYGLQLATGKYVAFVDSDDLIDEDFLTCMLDTAERYECDMVVTDASRITRGKRTHANLHRMSFFEIDNLDISLKKYNSLIFDTTLWNRLVLRSLYIDNKIEFQEGHQYEDFPVVWQLYHYAGSVRFIRNWGYQWRRRDGDNLSITQRHEDFSNINDKIVTFEASRRFAEKYDNGKMFNELLDYRMLIQEFNGNIIGIKTLVDSGDRKHAKEYLEIAAHYLEEKVNLTLLNSIPIYDRQKIDYILRRDLDGLIRLMVYKETNYENAPMVKEGGTYKLRLPSTVFPIGDRDATFEYANRPYFQSIDTIEIEDGTITLHPHIYVRKVNIPTTNSQKIEASIVNYANDQIIELDTKNEVRHSLTKIKGRVVNYDDYKEYYYNYDGTGFSVNIDLRDMCVDDSFLGKNYIITKCSNDYGESTQLMRYGSKQVTKTLGKGIAQTINDHIVTISLNEVDYLEICIEQYSLNRIVKENNYLVFSMNRPLFVNDLSFASEGIRIPLIFDKESRRHFIDLDVVKNAEDDLRLECRTINGEYIAVKADNSCIYSDGARTNNASSGDWECEINDQENVILRKKTVPKRMLRLFRHE